METDIPRDRARPGSLKVQALPTESTCVLVPPAIALMHPVGQIGRAIRLRPASGETVTTGKSSPSHGADLGWIVVTRRDCGSNGSLESTMQSLGSRLSADGLLYVMAPPGTRARVQRMLKENGWQVASPVAHLTVGGRERAFVPLSADGLRLTAEDAPQLARKALEGLAFLARRETVPIALAEGWPRVGIVAWGPGSPGPYAWLKAASGIGDEPLEVSSFQGWRGPHDSLVLRYRGTASGYDGIAKVSREGRLKQTEAAALGLVGDAARSAGARVPELVGSAVLGSRQATLMTRLEGGKAALRLQGRPRRLARIVELTGGWLERWNHATAREVELTPEELKRWILEPAGRLAGDLRVGNRYLEALGEACSRVTGRVVSRVSVHNDLTMHNVLVADDSIGIVDWETAGAEGLPLMDLEYMIVDAVAAVEGYQDRAGAWSSCFVGRGAPALLMQDWRGRSVDGLRLNRDLARLCHQACWLKHARNEAELGGGPERDRPFLEIVDRMAEDFVRGRHG